MQSDCSSAIAGALLQAEHKAFESIAPMRSQCRVCVVIPVRNEAETLETTLTALLDQRDLAGNQLDRNSYEVIVLANNCSDRSAVIGRQFAERYPEFALHVAETELAPADAYVGRVRQLLMDEAHRRFMRLDRPRGIIASTDGDTCVAPTWIAAIQAEIASGADAVSGRILTNPADRAQLDPYTRACYLRAVGYGYLSVELEEYIDPDPFDRFPRHHQHCGASLAVTAEMYAKAGGMPPVRTPEDVAFYRSLVRIGAKFRHSPLVWVQTSSRLQGRVTYGMANQLHEWSVMGNRRQSYLVESALAIETKLQARRQLREVWRSARQHQPLNQREIDRLSKLLGISSDWLYSEIGQAHAFGALHERVEAQQNETEIWQQRWQKVPVEQAIADLRVRVSRLRYYSKPYPILSKISI